LGKPPKYCEYKTAFRRYSLGQGKSEVPKVYLITKSYANNRLEELIIRNDIIKINMILKGIINYEAKLEQVIIL
jgi:hypothetical protein